MSFCDLRTWIFGIAWIVLTSGINPVGAEPRRLPPIPNWSDLQWEWYAQALTLYKIQEDYATPLDARDRNTYETGSHARHGANNRSKQNTRSVLEAMAMAKAGKQVTAGRQWYRMMAFGWLRFDADDPDHPATSDGERRQHSEIKDLWIRYSPWLPLAFTLGKQTILGTSIGANTYFFEGDPDDDFFAYGISALLNVPGVSLHLYLTPELMLGAGRFDSSPEVAEALSGTSRSEGRNLAMWLLLKKEKYALQTSHQWSYLGGKELDADRGDWHFSQKYLQTLWNGSLRINGEIVSPWLAFQSVRGEKFLRLFAEGDPNEGNWGGPLMTLGPSFGLELQEESRYFTAHSWSLGTKIDLKQAGLLAFNYTKIETAPFNTKGYFRTVLGLDSVFQSNYSIELLEGLNLVGFYHTLNAQKDHEIEKNTRLLRANKAVFGGAGDYYTLFLNGMRWSSSRSLGLALKYRFGGPSPAPDLSPSL